MCENVNSRKMRTEEELTLVDAGIVDWWEYRYYSFHRLKDLEEMEILSTLDGLLLTSLPLGERNSRSSSSFPSSIPSESNRS